MWKLDWTGFPFALLQSLEILRFIVEHDYCALMHAVSNKQKGRGNSAMDARLECSLYVRAYVHVLGVCSEVMV